MDSRLTSLFEAAAAEKRVAGVAAIALDVKGNVLFKGAFGTTNLSDPSAPKMKTSTKTLFWSCTKLMTSVAALQLVEQGKIKLDDPVEKYVPEFKELPVLEGWNEDGSPILRPQKTTATVVMLMTHTAGLNYDVFNKDALRWRAWNKSPPASFLGAADKEYYQTPLSRDPGTGYEYGINTDYLGFVVEAVSGLNLEEYMAKHIMQPLGMKNSGDFFADGDEVLYNHQRGDDGSLTVNTAVVPPKSIPIGRGGGHYLVSTLDDYSKFLLAILNGGSPPGSGPEARILKKETVAQYLFSDFVPGICSSDGIGDISDTIPQLTREAKFLPDVKKGWSCGLMLNLEPCAQGRSLASGAWAGLGNLYYWIDPAGGKLGLIVSAIFPFMDKEILHLFDAMERVVYGKDVAKVMGEKGSNFSLS